MGSIEQLVDESPLPVVLKGVADRSLGFLSEAWAEHYQFTPTQIGFESMPDALQVASPPPRSPSPVRGAPSPVSRRGSGDRSTPT